MYKRQTGQVSEVGDPQINQPDSGFRAATEFIVDLLVDAGPDGVENMGYDECLTLFQNGEVALWYGSTSAAPVLEAADSPMAGNVGYAFAPTVSTDVSGWLDGWGLVIMPGPAAPETAWAYIDWVTSADYVHVVADHAPGGWVEAPNTLLSTHDAPEYRDATAAYGDVVFDAVRSADPTNPGTTPRPGVPGVHYVGIPEFQDVAAECTAEISAAIAGQLSVDDALDRCQVHASEATWPLE